MLYFFLIVEAVQADLSVIDDSGSAVALEQPARRIVTLAPHITELLFAIEADAAIVGAVEYSDYPAAAQKIPRVGRHDNLDLETIFVLQPDLIVAWQTGNPQDDVHRLRELGFTLFVSEPKTLDDIASNLERLGILTGKQQRAETTATTFRNRVEQLTKPTQITPRLRVFYQVWHDPLITLNGDHVVSRIIQRCGGINVFESLTTIAPQVSVEGVFGENPDVIIIGDRAGLTPKMTSFWRKWPEIQAVRDNRLIAVNPDLLVRHTPRILDGMANLCEQLDAIRASITQ